MEPQVKKRSPELGMSDERDELEEQCAGWGKTEHAFIDRFVWKIFELVVLLNGYLEELVAQPCYFFICTSWQARFLAANSGFLNYCMKSSTSEKINYMI